MAAQAPTGGRYAALPDHMRKTGAAWREEVAAVKDTMQRVVGPDVKHNWMGATARLQSFGVSLTGMHTKGWESAPAADGAAFRAKVAQTAAAHSSLTPQEVAVALLHRVLVTEEEAKAREAAEADDADPQAVRNGNGRAEQDVSDDAGSDAGSAATGSSMEEAHSKGSRRKRAAPAKLALSGSTSMAPVPRSAGPLAGLRHHGAGAKRKQDECRASVETLVDTLRDAIPAMQADPGSALSMAAADAVYSAVLACHGDILEAYHMLSGAKRVRMA